jgi:hypothetical protein
MWGRLSACGGLVTRFLRRAEGPIIVCRVPDAGCKDAMPGIRSWTSTFDSEDNGNRLKEDRAMKKIWIFPSLAITTFGWRYYSTPPIRRL